MLVACALPFLTFGLYAAFNAVIFHCRVVRRPILLMGLTFPPFLAAQSVAVAHFARQAAAQSGPNDTAIMALAYGLPVLMTALLCLAYLQFYCLMEFSLSLRMLDHLASTKHRASTFHELRTVYPLEEVLARKCAAAGRVGLLRAEQHGGRTDLAVRPRGATLLRLVVALKRFCNWSDE